MQHGLAPTTTTPSRLPFSIRHGTFSDLGSIARVSTVAFWNDVLFGKLIHPHCHAYPKDNDVYWLRRNGVYYWDWSHVFLVAVTREPAPYPELAVRELPDDADHGEHQPLLNDKGAGRERVIGTAHWSRMCPDNHALSNYALGYDLAWWDPRRVLKPLFSFYWRILLLLRIRQNRAADPAKEDIIERSYGFLDHIWTAENGRSPCWYLECLAVRPEYQKCNVGRELVKWGLDKAEEEGICASVISAEGRERFYGKCGFDVGPVGWSGEGKRNPLEEVPGGLIFVRESKDVREGKLEREQTKRKGFYFGGREVEFV